MKRKIINTILWMVVFVAVSFCIGPITLAVISYTRVLSDTSLEHVLWVWRLIFIASPLVALFFGLRGALPGTKPLAVTKRSTNTISKILTLIVIVIVVLFTLGAWIAFQPPPGRPNISITFLGYTNDATGTRLAKIAVTNLNASAVLAYQPNIEIQTTADPSGSENYFSGVNCSWHSRLDRGASGNFTIPPPTNRSPWRLRLSVYPVVGVAHGIIQGAVGISCLSVGLMPRYMRLPYNIEGDWIKNEK